MDWNQIRLQFPNKWLLVEAIQASSKNGKRILEQLSVINTFVDSVEAMKYYQQLHHDEPHRELFVIHSTREKLDISERHWLGIRGVKN